MGKIERQEKSLALMIGLFCRHQHHSTEHLCRDCQELHEYALARLRNCRLQPHKPTCSKCLAPCYKPLMRQRILKVMRYAGPRMVAAHPIYAFWYVVDRLTT